MINKYKNTQRGNADLFGIILILIAVFVIWVLTGGQSKESSTKVFITPGSDQVDPLTPYNKN